MLHTVNKSPFEKNALESCLSHAVEGASILLIEDGVYAALGGTSTAARMAEAAKRFKVFVLGPDLAARGMDAGRLVEGVGIVDYEGFVDLVAEHPTSQAWL
ncbi:MAG: sulfurtransferase complex subunit TusB [Alphaproteobacteria bacterium]|nr:sulfurtransferase complex subunit TusB [Alphaproteobacteria bacterium]MBF0372169.1 sulfurtransferase complex subunit TusB [Alphaproteobacteria bacterium]MBF0391416.1 sulfurtransferase complex subunit TusB [Alphaproteobacteria bacterium]